MKIIPTVGRIVWFYYADGFGPRAAIVAEVQEDDRYVHLTVFNRLGGPFGVCHVPLIQDGEVPPEHRNYCTWMPYQIATAAKERKKESTGDTVTETT